MKDRKEKLALIEETAVNGYTVRELKNRIEERKGKGDNRGNGHKGLLQVIHKPQILFNGDYKSAITLKSLQKQRPSSLAKLQNKAPVSYTH